MSSVLHRLWILQVDHVLLLTMFVKTPLFPVLFLSLSIVDINIKVSCFISFQMRVFVRHKPPECERERNGHRVTFVRNSSSLKEGPFRSVNSFAFPRVIGK